MFRVKKNERGFTLVEVLIVIIMIAIFGTIGVVAFKAVANNGDEMKALNSAATLVEEQCGLENVELDLANASSKEEIGFTSSSNPSSQYTLKTAGVNVVVNENGKELCTFQADLRDFR